MGKKEKNVLCAMERGRTEETKAGRRRLIREASLPPGAMKAMVTSIKDHVDVRDLAHHLKPCWFPKAMLQLCHTDQRGLCF